MLKSVADKAKGRRQKAEGKRQKAKGKPRLNLLELVVVPSPFSLLP
jgi:hypothetical protein